MSEFVPQGNIDLFSRTVKDIINASFETSDVVNIGRSRKHNAPVSYNGSVVLDGYVELGDMRSVTALYCVDPIGFTIAKIGFQGLEPFYIDESNPDPEELHSGSRAEIKNKHWKVTKTSNFSKVDGGKIATEYIDASTTVDLESDRASRVEKLKQDHEKLMLGSDDRAESIRLANELGLEVPTFMSTWPDLLGIINEVKTELERR